MTKKIILAALATATLAACGGGGGGGSPGATTFTATCSNGTTKASTVSLADAQAQCPAVTATPIVVTVPAATYPAASEELAAFSLFNAERARCGFGLLAQNDKLDVAARGHADWLLANKAGGHYQTSGTTGFTGVTPDDRAAAAGYAALGAFQSSESEHDTGGPKIGGAVHGVRSLLNAPYHLVGMMGGYRDVGVAVRDMADMADIGVALNNRHVVNIDFGYKIAKGLQAAGSGSVRTYPCDGSTGVNRLLIAETPSPVPGRDLRALPLGTSVGVVGDVGSTLTITSATMTTATGAAVALRVPVTSANDPNAVGTVKYLYQNEGFFSADAPLDPNTQYQVNISGTNNGVVFSRSFMFTTGS